MFKHFSCQQIAPAFHRGAVEFVVDRVVVVHKACFFHHPAAGGVGGGMAAGQPAAVRVGEPVRHDGAESLGGEAFVPPLPADAVARLPDAVGQVQPRPLSLLLRLPGRELYRLMEPNTCPVAFSTMAHW